MKTARRFACVLTTAIGLAAASMSGQQFGITSPSVYVLDAWDMEAVGSSDTWTTDANYYRYASSGSNFFGSLKLPHGARLLSIELEGCDTTGATAVGAFLHRVTSAGPETVVSVSSGFAEMPGCSRFSMDVAPAFQTIDNVTYRYVVTVNTPSAAMTKFGAVRFYYQLQVSPAPAVQTFTDVFPNDGAYQYIEALAAAGVTAGCGGGKYCPDAPLTRRQMAVFLSIALGLHWPAN